MSGVARPGFEGAIPAGERIVLDFKPDIASIVLVPMRMLVGLGLAAGVSVWATETWPVEMARVGAERAWVWLGAGALVRVGWQAADWWARRFILTERRVLRMAGVFRRSMVEVPLASVQHVTLTRLFRERLTGLGTVGIATSGTAWMEMHWTMIARPRERLAALRRAIADAKAGGAS